MKRRIPVLLALIGVWLFFLVTFIVTLSSEVLEFVDLPTANFFFGMSFAGTAVVFCLDKFRVLPVVLIGSFGLLYLLFIGFFTFGIHEVPDDDAPLLLFESKTDSGKRIFLETYTVEDNPYGASGFMGGSPSPQYYSRKQVILETSYLGILKKRAVIGALPENLNEWKVRNNALHVLEEDCQGKMSDSIYIEESEDILGCPDGSCCFKIN